MTERNGLAAVFALCAVAMTTLLVNHPADGLEANHQLQDALVHGGFIVTQCILLVGFTIWSRLLGAGRVPVVVGMVSFCVGSGALMASMLLDGFVAPALAVRFAANPDTGRVLLTFCGTVIRFLMPWGLALQLTAMLSWSSVLLTGAGVSRIVGAVGVVCAVAVPAAFVSFMHLSAHLIYGAFLVQVVWYLGLAGSLVYESRRIP